MAKKAVDTKPEMTEDMKALIDRLVKEEQIEYIEEAKDQSEFCWAVWDIASYCLENPDEIVVSMYATPEEAAQAWAKFQVDNTSATRPSAK